ncbi:Gustatory receptor 173 [Halyomorpha halys]|nr:Gustatory receptor 173 [Halyomorpha halys]
MSYKRFFKNVMFTNNLHKFMSYSLIFPKICGMFPSIYGSKFNLTSYILLTIYLLSVFIAQYYAFKYFVFGTSYTWNFSKHMDIAELSLVLMTLIFNLESFFKKKSLINDVLNSISFVDRRLYVGKNIVTYNCYRGPLNNILRMLILILKFMEREIITLDKSYRRNQLYMLLAVDMPLLAIHFMNTPFLTVISAYSKHFSNLKSIVTRLSKIVDDSWKAQMDQILLIYVKLFNSASNLNELYSNILFFSITCAYLVILKHVYFMCYMCLQFSNANHYKHHNLIISPLYIILWSLEVYQISAFCALIKKQSLEFNEELIKLANIESRRLSRHRKLEVHLVFRPMFEFKGNQTLKFDYGLICSVITTAATYIAMLVQFASDWH